MFPADDEVELCQAQYCVPKPDELLCVAVAITYWVDAFELAVELPKCPAALMASLASCVWEGCDGAAEVLSYQTDVLDENESPPPANADPEGQVMVRSEERRVGEECRGRGR